MIAVMRILTALLALTLTGCGLLTPEQQQRIIDRGLDRILGPVKPSK